MSTKSIELGSSSSASAFAINNQLVPGIPDELGLKIFQHLPPGDLHRYLGARGCKDYWADRFDYHQDYIKQKTVLTTRDLKAYQRIFSITPGAFAAGQTNRIKVKSWAELTQVKPASATGSSSSTTDQAKPTLSLENVTDLDLDYYVEQCSKDLFAIFRACPKLTSINLSNSKYFDDSTIQELIKYAPKLTSLSIDNCERISGEKLKELAKQCPNLTALTLPCRSGSDLFLEFVRNCPKLTSIHHIGSYIDDKSLQEAATKCPELTSINFSWCEKLTNKGISNFVQLRPNLTSINLTGQGKVEDDTIKILAQNSPHLKTINLLRCISITDAAILALVDNCRELTSIDLTECKKDYIQHTKGLTDAAFNALAQCPNLAEINLKNTLISNASVNELLKNRKTLTSMNLHGCYIDDAAFENLAEGSCPNLTSIDLSLCFNLKDKGIETLVKACPNLKSIELRSCFEHISDRTLDMLGKQCKNLSSINLEGCKRISKEGVANLIAQCPSLLTIYLQEGGWIFDSDIEELKAIRPEIKIRFINKC